MCYMNINNYVLGQSEKISKSFSQKEVNEFAELSLDFNPMHLSKEYAEASYFKNIIVHGFLYSSLISAVIGTKLPGPGAIYLHQELNFKAPVFADELVTAIVTITDLNIEKSVLHLETVCLKKAHEIVVLGKAIIKIF